MGILAFGALVTLAIGKEQAQHPFAGHCICGVLPVVGVPFFVVVEVLRWCQFLKLGSCDGRSCVDFRPLCPVIGVCKLIAIILGVLPVCLVVWWTW